MAQTIDESRAQLIADLRERAEELAELNRIAIALTSEFDLQRLLQVITDAARKVTAAQYAAFFLIPEIAGKNSHLVGINVPNVCATLKLRQKLHVLTYCLPFWPGECFL